MRKILTAGVAAAACLASVGAMTTTADAAGFHGGGGFHGGAVHGGYGGYHGGYGGYRSGGYGYRGGYGYGGWHGGYGYGWRGYGWGGYPYWGVYAPYYGCSYYHPYWC